jgi:hypothetical protein
VRTREPLVGLHGRLENALELFRGDPRPRVAHVEPDATTGRLGARAALGPRVLHRARDLDAPRRAARR